MDLFSRLRSSGAGFNPFKSQEQWIRVDGCMVAGVVHCQFFGTRERNEFLRIPLTKGMGSVFQVI